MTVPLQMNKAKKAIEDLKRKNKQTETRKQGKGVTAKKNYSCMKKWKICRKKTVIKLKAEKNEDTMVKGKANKNLTKKLLISSNYFILRSFYVKILLS